MLSANSTRERKPDISPSLDPLSRLDNRLSIAAGNSPTASDATGTSAAVRPSNGVREGQHDYSKEEIRHHGVVAGGPVGHDRLGPRARARRSGATGDLRTRHLAV